MKSFFLRLKCAGGLILLSGMLSLWFFLPAGQAQSSMDGRKYSKILVLVKVQEPEIEKAFENSVVAALKDKGYNSIPSYSSFTTAELENTERLIAKADSLQVDALLAFTLVSVETSVINTPQVNASIGVPVSIGFFSVYLGTSVPLGGGPVEEKTVHLKVELYTDRNSSVPTWNMPLTGSLSDGSDALIYTFTRKTVKALFKQKIL